MIPACYIQNNVISGNWCDSHSVVHIDKYLKTKNKNKKCKSIHNVSLAKILPEASCFRSMSKVPMTRMILHLTLCLFNFFTSYLNTVFKKQQQISCSFFLSTPSPTKTMLVSIATISYLTYIEKPLYPFLSSENSFLSHLYSV